MRVFSGRDLQSPENRRRLDAISFVRRLSDNFEDEMPTILSHAHLWQYGPNEDVMKIGDSSGSVFLVINGRLTIEGQYGERLGELGPGEWLGDLSLFNLNSRTANVTSESNGALLLMIPKNILSPEDDSITDLCKVDFYRHISQGIRWKLDQALSRMPNDSLSETMVRISRSVVTSRDPAEWRVYIGGLSAPLTYWNRQVAEVHQAANSMKLEAS